MTDVLGKVISGEADAGLVYVTDVKAAGDKVHGVTFPESAEAVNTYPIAALAGSKHADVAKAFAALRRRAEGSGRARGGGIRASPEMTTAQQTGVPRWVLVPAAVGAAFIVLPLVALATRVEWGHFFALITLRLVARGAVG